MGDVTTMMTGLAGKILGRIESAAMRSIRGVPEFEVDRFGTYASYRGHLGRSGDLDASRAAAERAMVPEGADRFSVRGYCGACDRWTRFHADYAHAADRTAPNWRESLSCGRCWLNSRMRACFQLFRDQVRPDERAAVYMTEEVTGLFARVKALCPDAVGSEYLSDGTAPGSTNAKGVRCEDLTRLTFDPGRFDHLLSFEVLEHVPDYKAALRECARVLKPGGTMLLTTPFHGGPTTTARAKVGPGGVEHLLPPEYHGDPLSSDGCLCFYHFGGDLLDSLLEAGFREASICTAYSRDLGILMRGNPIFLATR